MKWVELKYQRIIHNRNDYTFKLNRQIQFSDNKEKHNHNLNMDVKLCILKYFYGFPSTTHQCCLEVDMLKLRPVLNNETILHLLFFKFELNNAAMFGFDFMIYESSRFEDHSKYLVKLGHKFFNFEKEITIMQQVAKMNKKKLLFIEFVDEINNYYVMKIEELYENHKIESLEPKNLQDKLSDLPFIKFAYVNG